MLRTMMTAATLAMCSKNSQDCDAAVKICFKVNTDRERFTRKDRVREIKDGLELGEIHLSDDVIGSQDVLDVVA